MCLRFFLTIFIFQISHGQTIYPQDYFTSPLEIPLILSGSFGELRTNHFHAGLDIKTQGRSGLKVKSSAEGYVSRIKISRFGYGKAIYIQHPNGYTGVYAHLKKFNPVIEEYVKKEQYQKESYEIELFPKPNTLTLNKNELIGFSGNTGGSGGPHLHFEIRDKNQKPINPLLFGFDIPDTKPPRLDAVYAYALNDTSYIGNGEKFSKLRLIPYGKSKNKTPKLEAYGEIGFGIIATDKNDYAPNKNGLYRVSSFLNGVNNFEILFKKFDFNETHLINNYIDYKFFKEDYKRVQKLFIPNENNLSLVKNSENKGIVSIKDKLSTNYKVYIDDFEDNRTELTIPLEGKKDTSFHFLKKLRTNLYEVHKNETKSVELNNTKLTFPKNAFFEDVTLEIHKSGDTLFVHKDIIPLSKNFYVNYDVSMYNQNDQCKLYIASLYGYKKKSNYLTSKLKEGIISAKTKNLGIFCLKSDDTNPIIKSIDLKDKKWMSNYRFLKFKINDKDSGIKNYRATINNQWILMEYDYKTENLIFDFNDFTSYPTKNEFKLIVTDNVGNSTKFESTFYRKK